MRALFIFLLLFGFLQIEKGFAQEGLPFLTHIELDPQYGNVRIGSIVQDGEETMFFSTSRGLLKFDGSTWELIATPSPAAEVIYHQISNRIFVALKTGAAEIVKSDSGSYEVANIPGIESSKAINRILINGGDVYFIGENHFSILNPLEGKDATTFEFPNRSINGAFIFKQNLFLIFYQDGLFTWSNQELVSVGPHKKVTEDQMLFGFQTDAGTYTGFENDELYLFNGNSFKPVASQLKKYLNDNLLSGGLLLNDSLMALSTLAGGAIIVDTKTQSIRHRFDYTTGVKDNEIYCLGKDNDEGLWLAFESGLSRIDLNQPVKSFSGFPGLEGNLTTSLYANGKLYVGSGSGVFVLQKATSAAEITRMMQNVARRKREAQRRQNDNYIPPKPEPTPSQKKKKAVTLLDRYKENPDEVKDELNKKELRELKKELRKQRKEERKNKPTGEVISDFFNGNNQEEKEAKSNDGLNTNDGLIPNPKTGPAGSGMTAPPGSGAIKRDKPQVLSKAKNQRQNEADKQRLGAMRNTFLFKKIKELDVKCRQLVQVDNQIFAATNNGLYIIQGSESQNLTPGLYINHVTSTTDGKKLLLATQSGVYELSKSTSGNWESTPLNESVQFAAYNVAQDDAGTVWAGTDNGAYRYFLDETKYYGLPDVANEQVLVSNVYGKMHFLLPSSLFHYISQSDTILPAILPDVPSSGQLEYLLGNEGIIWIKSTTGWRVLNGEKYGPMLPYMDLFEDIRHISTDKNGNIYVIDQGDNIYSILNRNDDSEVDFNIYIRQVADDIGNSFSLEQMNIETDGRALIFNVSAPFYLKSQGTQYQYRIGSDNKWSKWRTDSEISPGMLSPGNYVLEVRAKNILGEVSKTKTLAFTVQKPLYLRWYALLGYALILTLIV
ncbi:hypothetical protein OAE48_04600, partial [Flavobacteriales bacterium]|nr:hypothetical protein [Flavobacteriales bacterium]